METRKEYLSPVVIHPGYNVREWMEENEMTAAELAALGGIPEVSVRRIIEGREDITLAVAAALERATGVPADFWMRVQKGYEEDWVRLTREKGAKAVRLTGQVWILRGRPVPKAELTPAGV